MKVQNLFALDPQPDTFDDTNFQRDDLEIVDTSPVDPYRQGTEIRNQHQYLAGAYKILSGERGHAIVQQPIGQGAWRVQASSAWSDTNRFDPIELVESPIQSGQSTSYGDDAPSVPQLYDGLLDPVALVNVTLPRSNAEIEFTIFNGTLIDGNAASTNGATDQVVTVSEFTTKNDGLTFVDSFDGDVDGQRNIGIATVGPFFDADNACYELFNREFWPAEAPSDTDVTIVEQLARQLLRGDSYVQSWQRSATTGFQYASHLGTDSIAFGDMVHR